ncbi:MAG: hypothetical protein ACLTNJ_09325 [Parabacteroides distasonis]
MKTITIKKRDYILKYTLRAFFIFENLTGKQFEFGRMLDEYLLFYSVLLANNKDTFLMSFDEFVEACDFDPSLFASFKEFFVKQLEQLEQETGADIKKKTVPKSRIVSELYVRVVGEGGIAPDYFLDRMTVSEVRCFLEGLGRRNRESWEQTGSLRMSLRRQTVRRIWNRRMSFVSHGMKRKRKDKRQLRMQKWRD